MDISYDRAAVQLRERTWASGNPRVKPVGDDL